MALGRSAYMKQKNAAELRKLQEENRALRRAIKAGEQRRRAAVGEIISLNQRLQEALNPAQTGEMVLMTHQATMIRLAKQFGAEVGAGVWELCYPVATPEDLSLNRIESAQERGGVLTLRVSEVPADEGNG